MRRPAFFTYHFFSLLLLVFCSFSSAVRTSQSDGTSIGFSSDTAQVTHFAAWEIPNHTTTPVEISERSELTDVHSGHRAATPIFRLRLGWGRVWIPVFYTLLALAQPLFISVSNLRH